MPWRTAAVLAGALLVAAASTNPPASKPTPEPVPTTPREFFNAGTRKLQEAKLREAEAFLESALASQDERLQPPALFNLGHVRFNQGLEELKKGPEAKPTLADGQTAGRDSADAIRDADAALASNDVQRMVAAYLRGRGSRRELKAATTAVRHALESFRGTLSKWQRAEGDFRGALELDPAANDARDNADVVDRCIAKLVDSIRQMQQMMQALGQQKTELKEKMNQLKGRIPAPDMPPGAAGDDEDEEDQPKGPEPGDKEGATREGQEMMLSPEQAGWLLDSFRLDAERRLPMGTGPQTQPHDRNRPTW